MIEGPTNFIVGALHGLSQPRLVTIGVIVLEMFLVCHVNSQDHMLKGPGDFIGRGPSR